MTKKSCIILADSINYPTDLSLDSTDSDVFTWQMSKEGLEELTLAEESKSRINKEILESIKHLASKSIGSETLITRLQFKGFNTWFYHRFNIYFELREAYYFIGALNELKSRYASILVFSNDMLMKCAFEDDESVEVRDNASNIKAKRDWKGISNQLSVYGLRLVKAFIRGPRRAQKLIVSSPSDMRMISKDEGNVTYSNPFIGPLLELGDSSVTELSLFEFRSSLRAGSKHNRQRLSMTNIEQSHFGEKWFIKNLLSINTWKYLREFEQLIDSLNEALCIESGDLFLRLFWKSFYGRKRFTMLYFLQYLAYSRYFKKNRTEALLISNEYGPNQRSVIDAAFSRGVRSIGIQHGAFHSLHPGYTYGQEEMLYRPFPDVFLSWGTKWNRLFNELNPGHYCRLIETGIVRMDEVVRREHLGRPDIYPDSDLDDNIVLFATQPQRDEALRRRAAEEVFTMARNVEGVRLFLKLHPRETDVDYYHNIAKEAGCSNYRILSGNTDLYSLIYHSDVVITCFSTVGTEAILMERPLIVIDHLAQDVQGYIREGVGLGVRDLSTLESAIRSIIAGEYEIDSRAYEIFIKNNATSMDGQASKRALDILAS